MKKFTPLAILALSACTLPQEEMTTPDVLPPLSQDRGAPELAMLEHVLGIYFSSDLTNPPTVCAAMHDGREEMALDTQDEIALIARFPRLAPLSRCTLSPGGWRDDETDEPAMVFTLHSFTCASEERCTGWAGYRSTESNSMSYLYTGEWTGEEWTFTRDPRIIAE